MAVHRYWRASAFTTYAGGALALSEFQLLAGGARVDSSAALSASDLPISGSLSALRDASTATWAEWAGGSVPALMLSWDFGAGGGADVDDIRLGSSDDASKFLLSCVLQWSDDAATWITSKVVNGAAWPGTRALTQSFGGGVPYVRSTAYSIPSASAASISIVLPANLQLGSLLLVGVAARSTVTTPPAGWTELSVTQATNDLGQRGVIYSKIATDADSGATVTVVLAGSATISAYMVELASFNGTPVVEQVAVGKLDGAPSAAISVLNSSGDGRLAVVFGGTTHAFADTSATMNLAPASFSEWALRTVQGIASLRGGFFTRVLGPGGNTAGTLSSAGSSSASAWTWNVFLIVAGAGITQNRAARTRTVSMASAPTSAVAGLAYGATRNLALARGRRDYIYGGFGQSIGRLRGFTLDYVNPLNKPIRCRVRLVREVDGQQVREQWTAVDGSYDFQYIDELQSYTILAYYLDHGKRAVVTDGLSLANGKVELMA